MSNRVTITLTIDLPEGVVPDVSYGAADEIAPLPAWPAEAPVYDADVRVPGAIAAVTGPPMCGIHGPMKRYPAGTNKAGKPYNASWRCATTGCETKAIWDRDA